MVNIIDDKNNQYYEAILQLREVSEAILDYTEREIAKQRIPVAKVKEVHTGYDFYLGDGNRTKNLGKQLQEKFGGEYTVTATLFTRKEGRPVYRITVLFRGIAFKKGDLVDYKGEKHIVVMIGKKVMLQESKTGKKVHLRYKDLGTIKISK
ncbi:MAG: NMD3-related protein [Nanoarchaeota archaeon]